MLTRRVRLRVFPLRIDYRIGVPVSRPIVMYVQTRHSEGSKIAE